MEYVASNSRAKIIIVADEEQLDKVMQVVEVLLDHIFTNIVIWFVAIMQNQDKSNVDDGDLVHDPIC